MKKHNSRFPIPDSIQKIFLIGMPACGKTYWGERLAEEYGIQFTDLDTYITQEAKASIPALFASYGENGFREREHKYLEKLIKNMTANTIVACGGGTPCYHDNMLTMKNAGTVIYLRAGISTLLDNLKNSGEIRPLLKGRGDMATYLQELLNKRKSYYEQAHHILSVKGIALVTFAKIISL